MFLDDFKTIGRSVVSSLRAEFISGLNSIVERISNIDNTADIDKPVSTEQAAAIESAVNAHNSSNTSHTDLRNSVESLIERLNALADSDDVTLDQLSEIVAYIKNNKDLIDEVTTGKVSVKDIINALDSEDSTKPLSANQGKVLDEKIEMKVDKVDGKGLSANDYTTAEKEKLSGITAGAEPNVQADWSSTDESSDAFIKNKPTSMPASDVYDWAKAKTKPQYTKSEVGLDNVDNTADIDKPVSTEQHAAINAAVGIHNASQEAHTDIQNQKLASIMYRTLVQMTKPQHLLHRPHYKL